MAINWDDFESADTPTGTTTAELPNIDWNDFEAAAAPTPKKPLGRRIEPLEPPPEHIPVMGGRLAAEREILPPEPELPSYMQPPKPRPSLEPVRPGGELGLVPPPQIPKELLPTPQPITAGGTIPEPDPDAEPTELDSVLEDLSTSPIKHLPPKGQEVARKIIGTLGGGLIGGASDALSKLFPNSKTGQIAKGISEASTENAEFFTSPLGASTLGIGALPKTIQSGIGLAFTLQMASQVPELSRQLGDELGKPPELRDPVKISRLVGEAATTLGFTAAGAHGLTREAVTSLEAPAPRPQLTRDQQAVIDLRIRNAPAELAKPITEREVPSALQKPEAKEVLPNVQPQPVKIEQPVPAKEGDLGIRTGGEEEKGPATREILLSSGEKLDLPMDPVAAMDWLKTGDIGKLNMKPFKYGGSFTGWVHEVGSRAKTPEDLEAIKKAYEFFVAKKDPFNAQAAHEAYQAATGERLDGKPTKEGQGAIASMRKVEPNYQPPMSPEKTAANLRPSVDLPSGERAVAGPGEITHGDVLEKAGVDPKEIPHEDPARAFTDVTTGERLTRKQAEKETGIPGTAKAGGLDSQDLPRAETPEEIPAEGQHPLNKSLSDLGYTMGMVKMGLPGGTETWRTPTITRAAHKKLEVLADKLGWRSESLIEVKGKGVKVDYVRKLSERDQQIKHSKAMIERLELAKEMDPTQAEKVDKEIAEHRRIIAKLEGKPTEAVPIEGTSESEEARLVRTLSEKGTELSRIRKQLDYRPNDQELKAQWQRLYKDYAADEKRLSEIRGPKPPPTEPTKPEAEESEADRLRRQIKTLEYRIEQDRKSGRTRISDKTQLAQLKEQLAKAEKPAETPAASQAIIDQLKEPVQDVTEQRARLKLLQGKRDTLNKEYAGLDSQLKELSKKVLLTRGPKYMRGRMKQSAKKADVTAYRDTEKRMADLRGQMHQLDELGREDQKAVDQAIDAEIISNPKNTLLRRLDRKVRMMGTKAPAELVAALRAESEHTIREKYPDATPEEIKRLQPEVERAAYFNNDVWMDQNIPDVQALRRQALDAALNRPDVPVHQFPEDLMDRIGQFRAASRKYGDKNFNDPVKPLTARDISTLKRDIEAASAQIREENVARTKAAEEERVKREAEEVKLIDEAQKVADSAKRSGRKGGRDAKMVRSELVSKIKAALQAVIDYDGVKLTKSEDGSYAAVGQKSGNAAFGEIEPTDTGKFKVTVRRVQDKEGTTATVDTIEEAETVIKAAAAYAPGRAIIGVPGDGVFRLWREGNNLVRVWNDARKIDVSKGTSSGYKGAKSYDSPPKDISTEKKWTEAKEYHGLEPTDKIYNWSTALRALAERLNPKNPKGVTTAGVDKFFKKSKEQPPPTEGRTTTDETALQSGPALGIDEFLKTDVLPFLKKGVDAGKALVDIMVEVFSPASKTAERDVDALFEGKGFKEKIITRAGAALEASKGMFDAMSQGEQIDFVDRVKRGQRQPTPELQQVADLMRKWDDRLYVMAKRYKPGLPYLDNHNRVLWKVVPGSPAARGMSRLGVQSKRPWQGSKGFTRRHILDDMSQGIALGGVPVTYNPVEMFLLHAQDVMKFVAANRAWEGLKRTGSVEWVKTGKKAPDGYVRISDNISKPYFRTPTGLLAKTGEWYVEQGAARMIENYLSRDYIRTGKFGPIGRSLLALKNATTAIELGLSPFHAVFESNEVMGSSIGLGISKLASGKLSGIKDILGAPFSPKTTSAIGKAGIQFAKNPTEFARVYPDAYKWFTSKYPEARRMINDLFAGGGQPAMHEEYRVNGIDGFKKAVAQGNYPGAVLRAFPALNEVAMKPLFQTYIPRLKVGMFLREYSFELERNADRLASGQITRAQLARETWAFIEDRFGELNFDNLYWDRTFKSAMQIMFRSVTWKLGNLRGFGKATRDLWMEALKPLTRGEKPRITLPVAWLAGMAFVTAVQASIISKVSTGKYPWELAKDGKDMLRNLVFPRIDPEDERQRVSVPTYWRDLVHLSHSPIGYVGSSMTGEWRRLYDDLVNRDFYRHPIYNPNDPLQKKVVASLEHLVPLPFGLSSFIGATQEGVGPERAAAGFMGFTKAPSYVSPTSQTQLRDLAMKWKSESKIPQLVREAQRQATEQFEPSDYALLRAALKNRNYDAARKALDKLIEEGHKTKDISQAMRPLNKEGKPRPFTGSQLQEKYFIQSLTPKQRELYKESVRDRIELYLRFKEMLRQTKPQNN